MTGDAEAVETRRVTVRTGSRTVTADDLDRLVCLARQVGIGGAARFLSSAVNGGMLICLEERKNITLPEDPSRAMKTAEEIADALRWNGGPSGPATIAR